jgi:hypothetical protein
MVVVLFLMTWHRYHTTLYAMIMVQYDDCLVFTQKRSKIELEHSARTTVLLKSSNNDDGAALRIIVGSPRRHFMTRIHRSSQQQQQRHDVMCVCVSQERAQSKSTQLLSTPHQYPPGERRNH